jgi:pimeloyl-ACP methyl ester carboxylesterase
MEEPKTQPQSEHLTIAGHRIHCWLGGSGPNLLLIHAAWGDAEMSWSSVWTDLARSFTVIAPDLPGFGQSSHLLRHSVPAMVELLKLLLDELNVKRIVVAGNSFGATVALQFANAYPQLCERLVLVNGGYTPLIPGPLRKTLGLPVLRQGLGWMMRSMTYSKRALRRAFVHPQNLPHGLLDRIRRNSVPYSKIVLDAWLGMEHPLSKPALPTLLLWGAQDTMAPLKYALFIHKWIPGSTLKLIERSGHMPQVEQSEEFIAALQHFTSVPEILNLDKEPLT